MGTAVVGTGDVVGGRYRIEGVLGQGGMAVVYRARHTGTDQTCALKVILPHLAARPGVVEMFVKEARVGGRIGRNPHIVDVFDTGIDEARGLPFLAMELLTGETLAQAIAQGPVERGLMRRLMEQLGEALQQAHDAGVVHRDLKPSNLFVTRDRRGNAVLKVLDFGIAKVLEGDLHRTATEIGTPAYAAPEQLGPTFREIAAAQGVTVAAQVSAGTDLWPLGLIAYEGLTGHGAGQYWGATTASDLPLKMALALRGGARASARAAERAGQLPAGFDGWFERCLQIDATKRWSSAEEATAGFVAMMDGAASTATTPAQMDGTSLGGMVETFLPQAVARPPAPVVREKTAERAVGPETNLGAQVSTLVPERGDSVEAPKKRVPTWTVGLGAAGVVVAVGMAVVVLGGSRKGAEEPAVSASASSSLSTPAPSASVTAVAEPALRGGVTGEMVKIPAGAFRMGSNDGGPDEKPVHEVTVAAFELDRTEVTVAAYRACVDAGKCTKPDTGDKCNWGVEGRAEHPINCVDWNQATAFCGWAGKRLPTEEEWEYAARGTDGRKYPWGNEEPGDQLCWKKTDGTCPVGSYPKGDSSFGVHDLAGNVWEWTSSGYSTDYSKNRASDSRVYRGGSWYDNGASVVRSANRYGSLPTGRDIDIGFRCARP